MKRDHIVALSFLPSLPRVGLTDRLRSSDPTLELAAAPHVAQALSVRRSSEPKGLHVTAWGDPDYPVRLGTLPDAPPALWYRGNLECLAAPCVALVGARAASKAALELAFELGADLAARGLTVVSGLARGVDAAAHRGALTTGRTAAVLGGGVDNVYPAEHADLATQVEREGVVLTEYPPGTPPLPFHFPMRNRLISGLARGVVIVEAAEKSGSLITAGCALEQGREVMVVPGAVRYGRNKGGHALIRDGARIVETADDVVQELGWPSAAPATPRAGDGSVSGSVSVVGATGYEERILVAMDLGELYDVDELAAATGLDGPGLLRALTDLEMAGRVRRTPAGCCIRMS